MKKIATIRIFAFLCFISTISCTDDNGNTLAKNASLVNVTAIPGIEAVTLKWDMPSEVVTAFIISYNPGEIYLSEDDGTLQEIKISGLSGGVEHTFTISWLDANFQASQTTTISATPEIRPPGTFSGDLVFGNQSELDAFELEGEAALENIDGDLIIESDGSDNIFDLTVLKDLILIKGKLIIRDNPILPDLDKLSSLNVVEEAEIIIQNNRNLYNLCGLANVTGTNSVTISGNDFNPTFDQIVAGNCKTPDLIYTGFPRFNTQAEVDALPDGITHFPGELVIGLTAATNNITDLSKFSKVRVVGARLLIQFTPNITDLAQLRSLSSVGTNEAADELVIRSNQNLVSLNGLQALIYVARRVGIRQNPSLATLNGLNNLRTIGENTITIGTCGNATQGNPSLTNFCALEGIINSIGISNLSGASCIDNYTPFNPSFQDIINGNCSN